MSSAPVETFEAVDAQAIVRTSEFRDWYRRYWLCTPDQSALACISGDVPIIPRLNTRILAAVEAGGDLDMRNWHGEEYDPCGSAHCICGWSIFIAAQAGFEMGSNGNAANGALLFLASGSQVPDFNPEVPNDKALAALKARAVLEGQP